MKLWNNTKPGKLIWRHQAPSTIPGEFKTAVITTEQTRESGGNRTYHHQLFWICVWGKLGQGDHVIIVTSSVSKSSTRKSKTGVFTFLRSEERFKFKKLRFRDGLVWMVGLTVEIKLRFQIALAWCGRYHREIPMKEMNLPISEALSNEEFSCPLQTDWVPCTRTVPCCNQLQLWLSCEYQLVLLCRSPAARV